MGWDVIANLIISVGLPAAEEIWKKAAAGTDPTQTDFDELRVLAAQKAVDRALVQLKASGIDPESEQGKLFLTLIPKIA